jgi:hypothetical protein
MKFKYVDIKTTKNGTHRVLFTEDMKWFKGTDMVNALGTKFIYSITSTLEENGIVAKKEMKTPDGNRMYQFIEVEGILKLEGVIDALFPQDEKGKRHYPTEKRGYYESLQACLRDYKQSMVNSGILKLEGIEKSEEPQAPPPQQRLGIIFDELLKLSEEIDTRVNMEALNKLSMELSDAKAELQKTLAENKALVKESIGIKKQLELSEAKYEEVKKVNLDLIKLRDHLQAENDELSKFKQKIENLIGKGRV